MPAPAEVLSLIDRFDRFVDDYKRGHYNETTVRVEFIDPFFAAMGWDMHNTKGYAEAYCEVVHEDTVKIGAVIKAPDYSFRIGGVRKFFLEAKKPSVDIRNDVHPAYQVRRYAWSAKLPLSILTDFEEFAVYDCRIKPDKNDAAGMGRVLYLRYTDYAEKWDEIAGIFARESILQGAFDKYVESNKLKRGTAEVDSAFLAEIERWRELLARNIALRNPGSGQRELNFAVQQTIDRIIFWRIGEDRGIEPYGTLLGLTNGAEIYPRLVQIFRQADARYNSGLFHFEDEKGRGGYPDTLTPGLTIDDKVLRDILKNLYYPDSPYEFSVLPADILGQVYEQFLGKVIRLTKGGQAKVEPKPEVRKAGGVYYTPTYIVDYIVRQTVGKLVEGKRPGPRGGVSKLRIVDPACGSGSFLIGAYQYLLDWHLKQYLEDGAAQWAQKANPQLYQTERGEWRLTIDERKRILLNNLYGVDIDSQAVEVTKLSLLLKVLEGESQQTLSPQLALLPDRVLPDLAANIRCGNSLIGPDFYEGQMALLDEEEAYRVNALDWQAAFKEVFAEGGFDAVIGNPPWGADISTLEKPYFDRHYSWNSGKYESYVFFIERVCNFLKSDGILGYIVPSYWISRSQTERLRANLMGQSLYPHALVVLPEDVFQGVKMDSCIVVASPKPASYIAVAELEKRVLATSTNLADLIDSNARVRLSDWEERPLRRFNPRIVAQDAPILDKMEAVSTPLGLCVEITQGLTLYRRSSLEKQFGKAEAERIVVEKLFHSNHKKDATFKKELHGRDIDRYFVQWNGESWVSYGPWLAHAVDERFFHGPRLVVQKLRNPVLKQRLVAGFLDDTETYSAGTVLNIIPRPESPYALFYFMGLLNSRAVNYWYRKSILDVSIRVIDLNHLPVRTIDFADPADAARHARMVALVERMLELHKRLAAAAVPHEKEHMQRQIAAADRQIDALVYELYGLTEDEIAIVEGAAT